MRRAGGDLADPGRVMARDTQSLDNLIRLIRRDGSQKSAAGLRVGQ
jgi:hypothetical protein